jgi:uncharacterized protein YegP (UPF0339 family)
MTGRPPLQSAVEPVAKFVVTKNAAGDWFWDLISPNEKKIATSGESFVSKANALRAAESVQALAGRAAIVVIA